MQPNEETRQNLLALIREMETRMRPAPIITPERAAVRAARRERGQRTLERIIAKRPFAIQRALQQPWRPPIKVVPR